MPFDDEMTRTVNDAKRRAAVASTNLVKSGQIVGIGSGSTVVYMIQELGRRVQEEQLQILGVPTSNQTADLATRYRIPLTTLDRHQKVDLTIDGADQVDTQLNLIKGMGGALIREKIVAKASKILVIIVDDCKMTSHLGRKQVVPVEVIPFATTIVANELSRLGGKPSIRLTKGDHGRFLTDGGNNILDVDFGIIKDPKALETSIKLISGVVDSGLFVDMAKIVFVGTPDGVRKIEKEEKQDE